MEYEEYAIDCAVVKEINKRDGTDYRVSRFGELGDGIYLVFLAEQVVFVSEYNKYSQVLEFLAKIYHGGKK